MKKILTLLIVSLIYSSALAERINIEADELIIKADQNISAKNNIEVNYLEHNLQSDFLSFNKKTNIYRAEDNIIYHNKVLNYHLYADMLTSDSEFKHIKASNSLFIFNDHNYFFAQDLAKNSTKIKALKASYTNCDICKNNKSITPIWQIAAQKIQYDEKHTNIEFKHAFFKFYNIPILYSPFFLYPAPHIKKQTGFLTPSYQKNSILGNMLTIPYYLNLAPNYDLTYSPTLMLNHHNIHHETEFRLKEQNYQAKLQFSYIKENQELIEYLQNQGISTSPKYNHKWFTKFSATAKLKNNYAVEADIFTVSDKAYLERYQTDYSNYYNSKINLNQINPEQEFYIAATKISEFTDNNIKPINTYNLPEIIYSNSINTDYNINIRQDLVIYNFKNSSNNRENLKYSLYLNQEYISKNGVIINYGLAPSARLYHNDSKSKQKIYADSNVELIFKTKYPLIAQNNFAKYLITPKFNIIIAPDNLKNNQVNNLNSANSIINYSNINSTNKFSGTDLLERGTRFNYGFNKIILSKYFNFSHFIGQAYYFTKPEVARSSAIKEKFSDLVGLAKITFNDNYQIEYQYKLKDSDFTPYAQFANLTINKKKLTTNITYLNNKINLLDAAANKEKYLNTKIQVNLHDKLIFSSEYRRNLLSKNYTDNSGSIASKNAITLKGKCIDYIFSLNKDYINSSSSKSNYSLNFSFALKGL
ncbi:MAG: LPS-assembly protein LptD [Rickettsiales bacterium]